MIELGEEDLRSLIRGQIIFRKCPDCEGEGIWYYIEDSDLPVTNTTYEKAGGANHIENDTQRCETCKGVGYVSNQLSW